MFHAILVCALKYAVQLPREAMQAFKTLLIHFILYWLHIFI